MTTPSRFTGSGPKNEANAPFIVVVAGSETAARFDMACTRPPWLCRTAAMTAQMPKSMMMPWMKSLIAVAI